MTGFLGLGLSTGLEVAGRTASAYEAFRAPVGSGGAGAGQGLGTLGMTAQVTGGFLQAVGSYFAAEAAKGDSKSAAMSADHAARMADLNARQAELDAQAIVRAGRQQSALLTLRAGQERSRRKVSAAARGVVGNVGSAAELLASEDLSREIDRTVIRTNTVRAANAARTQSVNYQNQALLGRASAGNLRASARTINPLLAGVTSSLASAGRFAGTMRPRVRRGY